MSRVYQAMVASGRLPGHERLSQTNSMEDASRFLARPLCRGVPPSVLNQPIHTPRLLANRTRHLAFRRFRQVRFVDLRRDLSVHVSDIFSIHKKDVKT